MKTLKMLSISFILGILFISLLILSPAHSEVIVGEPGSKFQLKPLNVLNKNIIMVKGMAGGGRVEVEKIITSPQIEYFIHFRDETGRIYLSAKPFYPHLLYIQTYNGKVYTLEKEIVPDYSMVMARYNTARLQAEIKNKRPPILISDFIDEHRYYIREYRTELPEGKTILALPRIKGNIDMKDYPLNFIYTGDFFIITLSQNR